MMTVPELAALMREHRILRIVVAGDAVHEMELHPSAFTAREPAIPDAPAPIGVEHGGEPTPEQLLEWSTGMPLPAAKPEPAP